MDELKPENRALIERLGVKPRVAGDYLFSPIAFERLLDAARSEGLPVGGGGEGLEARPEPAMERRPNALPDDAVRPGGRVFHSLRSANVARQIEWANGEAVDLVYRANELAGEVGEACNVVKKLERERRGWAGSRSTVGELAAEIADVVICADRLAMTEGIDLDAAVAAKFNATSEKVGMKTRYAPLGQEVTATADGALGRQALSVQADPLNPPSGEQGELVEAAGVKLQKWWLAPNGRLVIELTPNPGEDDLGRLHEAVHALVRSLAGVAALSPPTIEREGLEGIRSAMFELYATVRGECPRLLNEDSGGAAKLDHDIRNALAKVDQIIASLALLGGGGES